MASHPALGMSVSFLGAGPDRAVDARAVSCLPLESVRRAIIASLPRADRVAVLVDGGLADGLRRPGCLPLVTTSNRSGSWSRPSGIIVPVVVGGRSTCVG